MLCGGGKGQVDRKVGCDGRGVARKRGEGAHVDWNHRLTEKRFLCCEKGL